MIRELIRPSARPMPNPHQDCASGVAARKDVCAFKVETVAEKKCTKCKETKSVEEFYRHKSTRDGRCYWCIVCHKKSSTKWEQENSERSKASHARWRDRNPDKRANVQLMRRYGITFAEYNEMITAQQGNCALCGKALGKSKRRHHVDHDHSKKGRESVRGILHSKCNILLGSCNENIEVLQAAIDYLKRGLNRR